MRNYTLPILVSVVWALSYLFTAFALDSFTPVQLITFRLFIAATLIGAIAYSQSELQRINSRHLPFFLLLATLEPTGYFLCETFGITLVSPVLASVVLSTVPLFSPFVARITIGEKLSAHHIIAVAVSFTGVVMLTVKGGEITASPLGLALLFGAVLFLIIYSIAVKRLQEHYSTYTIVTAQNSIGAIYFIPILLISGDAIPVSITASSLLSAIVLGVFASALAFVWFGESIKRIGVGRTNAFLNLMPAITAVASVAITGNPIETQGVVGIALVIVGLFASQTKFGNPRSMQAELA